MKKILAILAALVMNVAVCVGYGQSTVTQSTYPTVGAPCYVPGQKIIVQVGINVLAIFQCQSGGIVQIGGSPNPSGGAGTVTTSGSPSSGNPAVFSGPAAIRPATSADAWLGNAATATVLSQVTVPTVSLWTTAVNQQGTYSQTNIPQGVLIADSNTGTFQQIEGALAAYPGTAFTLDVLVGLPYVASSNIQVGILTASSATGNMELIGPRLNSFASNAIAAWAYYIQDFTAPATYSAGPLSGNTTLGATYIWLQYKDDGTYIYYNASGDGFTWGKAYRVLKTSGFLYTNGYNFIGVGMYPSSGTGLGSGFSVLSWKITTP